MWPRHKNLNDLMLGSRDIRETKYYAHYISNMLYFNQMSATFQAYEPQVSHNNITATYQASFVNFINIENINKLQLIFDELVFYP